MTKNVVSFILETKYNIFESEERQGHKLIFQQLQYAMDDINYLT